MEEGNRKREQQIEEFKGRAISSKDEAEKLRQEISTLKREYNHLLDEHSRLDRDISFNDSDLRSRLEAVTKQKAETDAELRAARDQVSALRDEVDRLRRHGHSLQQESADKEVKMTQLEKRLKAAREDNEGLNMALDAKQQELDLVSRIPHSSFTADFMRSCTDEASTRRTWHGWDDPC